MITKILLATKTVSNFIQQNFWVCIICILFVGFTLRVYKTDSKEPWFDEYCTIRGAVGATMTVDKTGKISPRVIEHDDGKFTTQSLVGFQTLSGVRQATLDIDRGNGLANNIMLHYWFRLWGIHVGAAYILFAIIGTLNIFIVMNIGKYVWGKDIKVLGIGVLMAISPLLIQFADRDIRSYSLSIFGCLLATISLLHILQKSTQNDSTDRVQTQREKIRDVLIPVFLYTAGAILALFSHYLSIAILFVHGCIMMLFARKSVQWMVYLISVGIIAILFTAWLANGAWEAYKVMSAHSTIWKTRALEPGSSLAPTVNNIAIGAFRQLSNVLAIRTGVTTKMLAGSNAPFMLISLVSLGALIVGIGSYRNDMHKRKVQTRDAERIFFTMALAGATVLTVLAIILSVSSQHCLPLIFRYASFGAPFGCFVVIYALSGLIRLRSAVIRYGLIVCIAVQIAFIPFSLFSTYQVGSVVSDEARIRSVIQRIDYHVPVGERELVFRSGYDAIIANIYALPRGIVYPQSIDTTVQYNMALIEKDSTNKKVLQILDSLHTELSIPENQP
jgi:hypothetical protein